MNNHVAKVTSATLLLLSVAVLPGCSLLDYFKKKPSSNEQSSSMKTDKPAAMTPSASSSGIVLASINKNPVITEVDFNKSMAQMLQSNPYFRGASLESLPSAIKKKFFDELLKQEVIIEHAKSAGLQKDPKFLEAYDEMKKLVKKTLTVQFFEKDMFDQIDVSDREISKHFDENKERFVKVAGGVLISGAKFKTDAEAQAFFQKAKAKVDDFEKLAQEDKAAKFKNFGRVSKAAAKGFAAASVPTPIRETAFGLKNLPAVEKVKEGEDHWVIVVSDKKETEYFKLDEIKPQVTGMIKSNKFKDLLDKKIKDIKGSMTVDVNEDFFKAQEAQEQQEAVDGAGNDAGEGDDDSKESAAQAA